jgi:hypothetical protein
VPPNPRVAVPDPTETPEAVIPGLVVAVVVNLKVAWL